MTSSGRIRYLTHHDTHDPNFEYASVSLAGDSAMGERKMGEVT